MSVAASSDTLGPYQIPQFPLREDLLENLESRDPEEHLKHFFKFQHLQDAPAFEMPSLSPVILDILSPTQPPRPVPHQDLTNLPKLTIPCSVSAAAPTSTGPTPVRPISAAPTSTTPYSGATTTRSPLKTYLSNISNGITSGGHI